MLSIYKQIEKRWFGLGEKIRFLLVGGANTLFSFLMYVGVLCLLGKDKYQISLIISWSISTIFSFSTQKKLVWRTKSNWIKEYFKCLQSWFCGYILNAFVLEISVEFLNLHVFCGQFFSIAITTVVSYLLMKFYVFKNKNVRS